MSKLHDIWATGGVAINGFLNISSGFAAETMARGGYDSLCVDMQHGMIDFQGMLAAFQAMAISGVAPLARVESMDAVHVGRPLDAGANGVICPMIESADDARRFVSHCLYTPLGTRSNGAVRPAMYLAPGEYQRTVAERLVMLPMIETAAALASVDEIASVERITGLYVGPTDLCLSLGLPPRIDSEEPELLAALEKIQAAAERRGLIAGMHCGSPAYARRCVDMGYRFVSVGSDSGHILNTARAAVADVRNHRPAS